jgi:hypothetical protein
MSTTSLEGCTGMAPEPDISPFEVVAERIVTALEQMKWTPQHDDPHGSALDFFVQVHQALRKN